MFLPLNGAMPTRNRSQLAIGALTFLAFALRVQRLDFQPLWGDEGWSIYFATLDLPHLLEMTARDIHPAFYYVLLKVWVALVGPTPVAVRLLSVFAGTLAVPLIFLLGRRTLGPAPAMMAALLLALSPFHVYYSQEVRMYGLVMLLGLASTCLAVRLAESERAGAGLWAAYVCLVALAVYTQYYAVFIPLAQTLSVFAGEVRRRGSAPFGPFFLRWMAAQAAWLVLFAPWLFYAGTQLQSYVAGKVSIEGYSSLGLVEFLARYLGAFALGQLVPAPLYWASGLFVALALLGALTPFLRRSSALLLLLLYLLVPLLGGWLINLRFPFAPSYVERTLLLALPPYVLLIGAGLAYLWQLRRRERWAALLAPAAISVSLALLIVPLIGFYRTSRYPEQDYRPLAARIAALGRPQDVIICSYQWQVGYFISYLREPHPQMYVVPGWGEQWAADPGKMSGDLETLLVEHGRLWFPAYQSLGHLWEDEVESYLAAHAYPVSVEWYGGDTRLLFYSAGKTEQAGSGSVAFAASGGAPALLLTGYRLGKESVESGWGVLPVGLRWQKKGDLDGACQVNLRLTDGAGRTWAARDGEPVAGLRPFARWKVDEEVDDLHGLLIPAGTPPGRYTLRLRLYRLDDGQILEAYPPGSQASAPDFALGEVEVSSAQTPPPPTALPIQHRLPVDLPSGLRFLGYSLAEGAYKPGQGVPLTLFWQALADGQNDYLVSFRLQGAATPEFKAETLAGPLQRAGDLLRDPHELLLPANLTDGPYRLEATLLRADGTPIQPALALGEIAVVGRPHSYDRPEVRYPLTARFGEGIALVGYNLREQEIGPGGTLHLTLFWQSLAPVGRSYKVFVHLLDDDGQIRGQRDQLPGSNGGRDTPAPTSGWLPGEYLLDRYQITAGADTPPGDYLLAVGLYDADDGQRLPLFDRQQPEDSLGDRLTLEGTPIKLRR